MGIFVLAVEAIDGAGVQAATIAATGLGYVAAGAGVAAGWRAEARAANRNPLLEKQGDLGRYRISRYRIWSARVDHAIADLMLILTVLAAIVGPIAGLAQHSWLLGVMIGGIGAPAFTAYRRLEHAAHKREQAADHAEDMALERSLKRLEIREKEEELDMRRLKFQFKMQEKQQELTAGDDTGGQE